MTTNKTPGIDPQSARLTVFNILDDHLTPHMQKLSFVRELSLNNPMAELSDLSCEPDGFTIQGLYHLLQELAEGYHDARQEIESYFGGKGVVDE